MNSHFDLSYGEENSEEESSEFSIQTPLELDQCGVIFAPPGGILTLKRIRQLIEALPDAAEDGVFWQRVITVPAHEGGIGFLIDRNEHPQYENVRGNRTPHQFQRDFVMPSVRFWSADGLGGWMYGTCGIDMAAENFDEQWEFIPEGLYRKRLSPAKKTCRFYTKDEHGWLADSGINSVIRGWEEFDDKGNCTDGGSQNNSMEYDLFHLSNIEGMSLDMMIPLYKALKQCGFLVIATKGFSEDGALKLTENGRTKMCTHLSYNEFKAIYKEKREDILRCLTDAFDSALAPIILSYSGCYESWQPSDPTDRPQSAPRLGKTKAKIREEYEMCVAAYPDEDWKFPQKEFDRHPQEWPSYREVKRRRIQ